MTREMLQVRLDEAQGQQQALLQQRARLAQLLEECVAQLNVSQGRIAELTDLIALAPSHESSPVGGTD